MAIELFNTLSGKVEEFHPLEDNLVRMYACGPTVYDYGHIGNFRTFIVVDTLRRFLKQSGYQLKHVMNITDVDDKIIRNAARDGVTRAGVHEEISTGVSGGCRRAEYRASRNAGERHRPHQRDGATSSRGWCEKGYRLPHRRRLVLLPHRQVSGVRQAVEEGLRRAWTTARAWMWTSTTRTTRATSRCGRRPSRARRSGRRRSGRGVRAGTSSARPCRWSTWARRFDIHAGRRGPDLPAPRERDRAVGGDDRQAVRALLGTLALPAGRRREDGEERWQLLIPSAT